MKRNKIISLSAVCTALIATVGMDYLIVPVEARSLWILYSIAAAALVRLYLFYEGTALAEYNENHAKKAYHFSIGLSVLFGGYIIAIWFRYPATPTYYFVLLLLLTFSVLAAEWVFAKRVSYQVSPQVLELKNRLIEIGDKQEQAKRILTQVWKGWRAAKKRIASLESEAKSDRVRLGNMEQRLQTFEPLASIAQRYKGNLVLMKGRRFAICLTCINEVLVPNRANEAFCPSCRELLWEKTKEVSP